MEPSVALPTLPITVIGSYPKPEYVKLTDWFKTGQDHPDLARETYEQEMKNGSGSNSLENQLLRGTKEIVCEQCNLGVHVPTDGEIRRDNYV